LPITEIRAQLARILESERFAKSPQLGRFLRYCVEQALLGHATGLKEQILGTEVFRRPSPFDPRLDPIVRVEARRLRAKLDQYYAAEGASDPLVISFQRGDYVPRFLRPVTTGQGASNASANVLIVEDELIVARDLENRLKSLGYTVAGSTRSGDEALELCEQLRPDLVLMDIVLAGGLRGTEAARRIWSRWQTPVVYLTAFSDANVLQDVNSSESYGYILKPFDSKQLNAVLQIALGRRRRELADIEASRLAAQSASFLSAFSNAQVRPWEWLVKDAALPWPVSVEASPNPVLASSAVSPSGFFERILPADRERATQAFTAAIRDKTRLETTYRRSSEGGALEWVIAVGAVAENRPGVTQFGGVELCASEALRADHAQKFSDVEQFVFAAGHDLQEPLRTIRVHTQLLAQREGWTDPVAQALVGYIESGVERMHALVCDLLAYTRLTGEEPAGFERIALDTALDQALGSLQASLDEAGAEVTREPLPTVMAGGMQIAQLFQNLISNAVKYRREDVPLRVHVGAISDGPNWRITVRDNGMGFDPSYSNHIFEAFKRLHGTGTPGTGLGLAICRRIVEAHGGTIWAESRPGQGSEFHFTLPALAMAPLGEVMDRSITA
jgi:signal transduction histidine kinase